MKKCLRLALAAVLVVSLMAAGCQQTEQNNGVSGVESGNVEAQTQDGVKDDYAIQWADPIVEQFVRRHLDRHDGDIYRSELDGITRFGVEKREANALTGITEGYKIWANGTQEVAQVDSIGLEDLQHFHALTELGITRLPVDDLSFLSGLTELEKINIIGCGVADISPLSHLTNLYVLYLDYNSIEDISPIAGLESLRHIRLYNNKITDLSALSALENLEYLWLGDNEIADYSPLYGLPRLKNLTLGKDVTDEQRAELRENLPFCTVNG